MKIIALETSTQPGSIAARLDETLEVERSLPSTEKTAESFASELQRMLRELNWAPTDVDAIAVCEGPGSFTGLRIGATVAKTFSYATGASVVAPSTMRVLANQAQMQPDCEAWCVIDAQRGEIFASLYRHDSQTRSIIEVEPTRIYRPTDWLSQLQAGQMVIGEGLKRVDSDKLQHATVCDSSTWTPNAGPLAATACKMMQDGQTTDAWKLTPQYYRKSAAEEKLAGLNNN